MVRGTTRTSPGLGAIEAVGTQAAAADPDRLGTLLPLLQGVSAVCWLMGSAKGTPEAVAALHGPRLQSLLAKLVDTPVRGLVYEAAGTVPAGLLAEGSAIARGAGATHRMPVRVVEQEPEATGEWLAAMRAAVTYVLTA